MPELGVDFESLKTRVPALRAAGETAVEIAEWVDTQLALIGSIVTNPEEQSAAEAKKKLDLAIPAARNFLAAIRAAALGDASGMSQVAQAFSDAESQNVELGGFLDVVSSTTSGKK